MISRPAASSSMEISSDRTTIGAISNVTATVERESDGAPWTIVLHRHHSRELIVLDLGDVGRLVELAERHGWRRVSAATPAAPSPASAPPPPPDDRTDARQWRTVGPLDPASAARTRTIKTR
jgi:hypothetical protein